METDMYHPTRALSLLLSAALALTAVPFAAASAQTMSIKVHSYDLDLTNSAGQAELQHRIDRAVGHVCGPAVGARMDELASYASCSKVARARAMSQYDVAVKAARDSKFANGQNPDVIVR
jgi:UrcA family protein